MLQVGATGIDSGAIAQAVSRRLPTAAAGVQAQVRSCGICGGKTKDCRAIDR
jgi:hypothetical protein